MQQTLPARLLHFNRSSLSFVVCKDFFSRSTVVFCIKFHFHPCRHEIALYIQALTCGYHLVFVDILVVLPASLFSHVPLIALGHVLFYYELVNNLVLSYVAIGNGISCSELSWC